MRHFFFANELRDNRASPTRLKMILIRWLRLPLDLSGALTMIFFTNSFTIVCKILQILRHKFLDKQFYKA